MCVCVQETHSEQATHHPPPPVEGQPRDGPRSPVQQRPAGSGSVPSDHLLLPGPDPRAATPGETAEVSASALMRDACV